MSLSTPVTAWAYTHLLETDNPLLRLPAVGIELEYENVRNLSMTSDDWVAVEDGSLRNRGVELVSRPLLADEVEFALSTVETMIANSEAESTPRCGLHTHMNMRPYSIGQVWSLICLYALIEPTLFQTYAVGREDNVFAVPFWANTAQQNAVHQDISAARSRDVVDTHHDMSISHTSKYCALNFTSLINFGTLEMRQPYCSVDFAAIRSWVDFCFRLSRIGVSYNDPEEVLSWYESDGLEVLQRTLFGDTFKVEESRQELAEDAAYMCCGYTEPTWQELTWELA